MEKKPPIILKKTRGGAYQYGGKNARKSYNVLFRKFLNNASSDPNIIEKMERLEAAHFAASSYDNTAFFEKQAIRFAQRSAAERRKKPVKKKPKKK